MAWKRVIESIKRHVSPCDNLLGLWLAEAVAWGVSIQMSYCYRERVGWRTLSPGLLISC